MASEAVLAKGIAERIGIEGSVLVHTPGEKDKIKNQRPLANHREAIAMVVEALTDKGHGVIENFNSIDAVGHRVVHGGEGFSDSVLITKGVMDALKRYSELAPLHNPPNIMGIEACSEILPGIPQVGVFDTAFHQTMPAYAFSYGLPYELYKEHSIRRYGFHGTSHKYVSHQAAQMLNKPIENLKIVTCHLGNGASVTAVDGGKSVDTSMGFTPLEGLLMGTRCGDIDPAIVVYLQKKLNLTADQVNDLMNKKSGVFGLSGVSSDFRDIEAAEAEGNERAKLALEAYYYRVTKYIGAYAAAMNGIDALVFTAGLGENSPDTREAVCARLEFLGIKVDKEKNRVRSKAVDVSAADARVPVLVVPTNEELMIARDTREMVSGLTS
jgi:acetate kinase